MQSSEDEKLLREVFQEFDINKDGQISKDELVLGYTQLFSDREMAIVQANRILEKFDINRNGLLDYSGIIYIYIYIIEFIMANVKTNKLFGEKELEAAFRLYDLVPFS